MMQDQNDNKPKHNKLKLVYEKDSYIYVEHSEADLIIKIAKYLQKFEGFISMQKMIRDLKVSRTPLALAIRTLAGIKSIEMIDKSGQSQRLCGRILKIQKEMFNSKRNYPGVKPYIKAPIKVCKAHT